MNSILPPSRKHDITFHPSGKIDISAHIARSLALAPGDVIGIMHEAAELYLYVKLRAGAYVGRHDGHVWAAARGRGGTFRTWSRTITSAVLAAAGTSGPLRCPCGAEFLRNDIKFITIIHRCSL